jgi:hypothetical protein
MTQELTAVWQISIALLVVCGVIKIAPLPASMLEVPAIDIELSEIKLTVPFGPFVAVRNVVPTPAPPNRLMLGLVSVALPASIVLLTLALPRLIAVADDTVNAF